MSDAYNATLDGQGSYTLAIAALRENGVRLGIYEPQNDAERRQAEEGIRAWSELDCVRGAK